MVLLARLAQKGKAVGDYHLDEDPPGQDRPHDGPLQEVETEKADHAQHEQAPAQVAEPFSRLLGALDEPQYLEEVVGLSGSALTIKM